MALVKRSRILVVYPVMPLSTIASAIISSVINSIVEAVLEESSAPPQTPIYSSMARAFPADSQKGELYAPLQAGALQIGNKTFHPAPGLQIRNEMNMIVMSGTLQQNAKVRYQLDPMGNVWRIWLLTAEEVAAADVPPTPTFMPQAQPPLQSAEAASTDSP